MSGTFQLPVSPYCAKLRSKKWFFQKGPAMTEEDILDGSGDCWCKATQMSVGPDGGLVDPEDCQSRRECFETVGGASVTSPSAQDPS